jgi:hypothetical protein
MMVASLRVIESISCGSGFRKVVFMRDHHLRKSLVLGTERHDYGMVAVIDRLHLGQQRVLVFQL